MGYPMDHIDHNNLAISGPKLLLKNQAPSWELYMRFRLLILLYCIAILVLKLKVGWPAMLPC